MNHSNATSEMRLPLSESAHEKYRALDKHWIMTMSLPEAEELSRQLAHEISRAGDKPDLIVGIANGALLPTKVVAETLGVPFRIVKVRRQGSRYKQKLVRIKEALHLSTDWVLWGPMKYFWRAFEGRFNKLEVASNTFDFAVRDLSIALIDDCIVTGGSVRHVAGALKEQGARRVTVNVLCWCQGEAGDTPERKPDVHLHRHIQFYPWSSNHPDLKGYLQWLKSNGLEHWE
ncbi:MAG: phosphoribosyltransferase [Methylacidiphilales bacterium]|nr:phosphoribosyltransferase [Candidatus Methylacidiphilales bacterium]